MKDERGSPPKKKKSPATSGAVCERAAVEIIGQLIGIKNLKIAGGWRLEIDLFDSRLADVLRCTALVNERQACKITLEPVSE